MALKNTTKTLEHRRLAEFVARRFETQPEDVRLKVKTLGGGLTSTGVAQVRASYPDRDGRNRSMAFVVKQLAGDDAREAAVYRSLAEMEQGNLAPQLLEIERPAKGVWRLYLEAVRPWRRWPWRETNLAGLVLEQLARVHEDVAWDVVDAWDYDAELAASAQETLDWCEAIIRKPELSTLRPSLPAVRRMVAHLPAIRRELVAQTGEVVLHGDAHPGNAAICRSRGRHRAVLLDWGRARKGSALEDVSSWLQTLAYWEPQVRRRHDTLLRHYLRVRGLRPRLDRNFRDLYWLAGASNAMSGALRYHLLRAADPNTPRASDRSCSFHAAKDWLRIIRRADACWKARPTTSGSGR